MKIQTECVPCLIKRIRFEAKQSTKDPEVIKNVIKNAEEALDKLYDPNECSITIATKVHKIVYETLGDNDPYKKLKIRSNKVAQSLIPKVEELIKKSDDPLKTSMICAVIGNLLDFGIVGASNNPEQLNEIFEESVKDGLGYDDTDEIKKLLSKSKKVLFFTDNCGEFNFDKILCREIKKFSPDISLTLVVKGEPVLSDATMDDAKQLKFDEVVNRILTTGCFAVGVDFKQLPEDLKKALDETDLIICKGMANYEAFSETDYHPIAYLMRVKCNAIANSMNLSVNINAVKLYK
jgi:hypothetical protein